MNPRDILRRLFDAAIAAAWRASVLRLAISDVPGDDPAVIASGPTRTNVNDFRAILVE